MYQIIDVTIGSTLPRVAPEVVDNILIPLIELNQQKEINDKICKVFWYLSKSTELIYQARSDVEAMIEG